MAKRVETPQEYVQRILGNLNCASLSREVH